MDIGASGRGIKSTRGQRTKSGSEDPPSKPEIPHIRTRPSVPRLQAGRSGRLPYLSSLLRRLIAKSKRTTRSEAQHTR